MLELRTARATQQEYRNPQENRSTQNHTLSLIFFLQCFQDPWNCISQNLSVNDMLQLRVVSASFKDSIESDFFWKGRWNDLNPSENKELNSLEQKGLNLREKEFEGYTDFQKVRKIYKLFAKNFKCHTEIPSIHKELDSLKKNRVNESDEKRQLMYQDFILSKIVFLIEKNLKYFEEKKENETLSGLHGSNCSVLSPALTSSQCWIPRFVDCEKIYALNTLLLPHFSFEFL